LSQFRFDLDDPSTAFGNALPEYWELVKTAVTGGGISFYQQDDAPSEAKLGDRWLNTQNLTEYIYVQMSANPDVFQWMDLTGDYPGDTFVGD
jgi:hypothetical protein